MSSSTILGYAAKAAGEALKPFYYETPELGENEVRVAITHCGVCYTDIQGIDDHYQISTYPFVPGHEIVGYVSHVGKAVTELIVGDRVGVGWQGRSCMQCEWCLQGEEQLCTVIENCGTWKPYGGFSSAVVVDSRFAYLLPEEMSSENAAVLMCAGISAYNPLQKYAAGGSLKVGVVGVGGLGHLAIQIARAMGNDVTAISCSPDKKEQALKFGADHFILADDETSMRQVRFSFDLLLYTSHGRCDWTPMVNAIKRHGRLVIVGFSDGPVAFDPLELIAMETSVTGSFLGSRLMMKEMLSYAQAKGIAPEIELMPMLQANEAIQRMRENKARYRIVLVNEPASG
jgi:uncharacterized zinc-type alcohol dehydrogenase-like protein